jgi:hypothetical protein
MHLIRADMAFLKNQKGRQIVDDVVAWVDKCKTFFWGFEAWLLEMRLKRGGLTAIFTDIT